MKDPFKLIAVKAARAADDKKAVDIVLRRTRELTTLTEYVLVATVGSRAQLEAVYAHIRKDLKDDGILPVHWDGSQSEVWRVIDYGGLLVHLMHPDAREFYSIDKVFHEGPRIRWAAPAPRKKAVRKTKKKTGRKKASKKKVKKR